MTKPTAEDYQNVKGFKFTNEEGLQESDLRKDSHMQVKLFNECNTTLEKREFLLNAYAWDNICAENNAQIVCIPILEAEAYGPNNFEYFGKIKTLKRAEKSVQDIQIH